MQPITFHYIYDPLCGWCYGITPLITLLQQQSVTLKLHGGGMITGDRCHPMDSQWRNYILGQDKRIGNLTGQLFSDDYIALLNNDTFIMDSLPPTAAILVAEQLGQKGAEMLSACQTAHYVRGLNTRNIETLTILATELGFTAEDFITAYQQTMLTDVTQHIEQSRHLMAQSGSQGFPTLLVEKNKSGHHSGHNKDDDKNYSIIPITQFIGNNKKWLNYLNETILS